VYLIRLAAFLLILFAILDKNRKQKAHPPRPADQSSRRSS
jgi:hypothetical protein